MMSTESKMLGAFLARASTQEIVDTLRANHRTWGLERTTLHLKHFVREVCFAGLTSESASRLAALVRSYSLAFAAAEVGALGVDLIEPLLKSSSEEVRVAALECIARWAVTNPEWVERLQSIRSQERAGSFLRRRCDELLETLGTPTPSWADFIERPDVTNVVSLVQARYIPALLERLLGVSREITIDLIECAKTHLPWTRASNVQFDFSEPETLHAWCARWCLSMCRVELDDEERWEVSVHYQS
jgi:hypothetical protein